MWYSVEALFRCNVHNELDDILFERKIFLINVDDKDNVAEKATQISISFETKYKNSDGNDVFWQFIKVLDVQDISEDEIHDGIEVFSRLIWQKDVPNE
jgi:hypothetical protein